MTGENPASWLAQFVFINLNVYLKTDLNWLQVYIECKPAQTIFQKLIFLWHFSNIALLSAKNNMKSMNKHLLHEIDMFCCFISQQVIYRL